MREIKRYQKYCEPLTARKPFERRVRNIVNGMNPDLRFKKSTIDCIREAVEAYLVNVLEDSNLCAVHAMRKTVIAKDIWLANRIRGEQNRAFF